LYEEHIRLGAKLVSFGGWEMPLSYGPGPVAEHHRVREAAGIFDLSHMGELFVSGSGATDFLQHLVTSNVRRLKVGEAAYAPMCYADGGLVDDTFIYRLPDGFWVVVNAANTDKDLSWIRYLAVGQDVNFADQSKDTGMLALQGPAAESILEPLTPLELTGLARNRIEVTTVLGRAAMVARTGYTGEDGFEIYVSSDDAVPVWRGLLEAGRPFDLIPVGLAARDSLRFEACFPLYGHELSAEITPLEAGLSWAVALRKGEFIGREALLKQRLEGVERTLVGFEMIDRGVPRHGLSVYADGERCGTVTSGLYAPTLDRFLGLAYLPPRLAEPGAQIAIELRGQMREARLVQRPFYTPTYQRKRTGG